MEKNKKETTLRDTLSPYFYNWRYIVISILAFLIAGSVYLLIVDPRYTVSSKVVMRDRDRGQISSDIDIFKDLNVSAATGNIDNEIEVLKSNYIQRKIADSLNLNVRYYRKTLFGKRPLTTGLPVEFRIKNHTGIPGTFNIVKRSGDILHIMEFRSGTDFELKPGQWRETEWGSVCVTLKEGGINVPLIVKVSDWSSRKRLEVKNINKNSAVVNIYTVTDKPELGIKVINLLVEYYNQSGYEQRNKSAERTISFIEERLDNTFSSLEFLEKEIETYKRSSGLTDIQAEALLYLNSGTNYDVKIAETQLQKDILTGLQDYINRQQDKYEAIPSDLGISDKTLLTLIDQYNIMLIARRESLMNLMEGNPVYEGSERQVEMLKNDIKKGIEQSLINCDIILASLHKSEREYNTKIKELSTTEREYRTFARQKETTEQVYLYLMQLREDALISLSMAEPNAVVIEPAFVRSKPHWPRRDYILFASLLLGIFIPVGYIYGRERLSTRIISGKQVEELTSSPLLGMILPEPWKKRFLYCSTSEKDHIESYRMVDTHLRHLINSKKGKVVMVTSFYTKEGKSSFALNLAKVHSSYERKVLLVDMDMRNAQLSRKLDLQDSYGISTYLSEKDTQGKESQMVHRLTDNLDVIPVGTHSASPCELLQDQKLDEVFSSLRNDYDIIIIDVPVVSAYADPVIISRVTDVTVLVLRAGISGQQNIITAEKLQRENKLKGLSYVLLDLPLRRAKNECCGYENYNKK